MKEYAQYISEYCMKDQKTFESIYMKYYPVLMVYGKNISNDEQLIEDAIQELFITLWKKREDLVFHSSFKSYLFVAFRNNLIRKVKENKLEEISSDIVEEPLEEKDFENEKKLKILLEKLPPRQKEVLFLRYYQNKSYLEIAEMLGISYQVTRNFSYRAIKFLKKKMKNLPLVVLSIAL